MSDHYLQVTTAESGTELIRSLSGSLISQQKWWLVETGVMVRWETPIKLQKVVGGGAWGVPLPVKAILQLVSH